MNRLAATQMLGMISVFAIVALLVAVIAALAAGIYAWSSRSPARVAGHMEQITIATNTEYVGTCPVIAARDKGYFANEGILAVIQPYSSGKASMEAVVQGHADLGTVADIPIMIAGMNDQHVSVIATIFKTEKDHGIVGRKDRGIDGPASLKGKKIGVTLSTSGHFALDAILNRQRLSPDEVTMRNYKPEDLSNALARGDVDAVATWQPFLGATMEELRGKGIIFYGQDIYESLYSVAGMREYVTGHPESIKKILRALILGAQYCSDTPDAMHKLVAEAANQGDSKSNAQQQAYQFDVVLDQELILALEDEARWAIKNKITARKTIPNYLNYIYLDGMEAVAPSAVTIIH